MRVGFFATLFVTVAVIASPGVLQAPLLAYDPVAIDFDPAAASTVLGRPDHVSSADLDRDGDVDLLISASRELFVALNDGTGRFSLRPVPVQKPPTTSPSSSTTWGWTWLGDLDLDQDPDLLVQFFDGTSWSKLILENDGKGNFAWRNGFVLPTPSTESGALIVDLDGDGVNDILIGYELFRNVLLGRFTRRELVPGRGSRWVSAPSIADFNGDGRPDVFLGSGAVANPNDEVVVDDGQGGYRPYWVGPITFPHSAAAADVNGDGWADLVVHTSWSPRNALVFHSDTTTKTLRQVASLPIAVPGSELAFHDVDGDGDLDLVASSGTIFANDGKGVFRDATAALVQAPNYPQWAEPRFLNAADIDGDGDVDFAGVLYQRPPPGPWVWSPLVLRHRRRHVESPETARLGTPLAVTLFGDHRHALSLGVSLGETRVPFAGWGDLRLDPRSLVLLPPLTLQNRVPGVWSFTVPRLPALAGLRVRFQAVDVDPGGPVRLSGLQRTEIIR